MFLQQLPDLVRWLLLFVVGATLASFLNWAIYGLTVFEKRFISPWQSPPDKSRPRTVLDKLPLVGWFRMRREADLHGSRFWIRPLLIEIAFGIFLVWFYEFSSAGGLFGKQVDALVIQQQPMIGQWTFGWFLFHSVLVALMTVATFIDFDEQTIPDWITIPGTLLGIFAHALCPSLRLPTATQDILSVQLEPLRYFSPEGPSEWHLTVYGLGACCLAVWIWCFGLTPKIMTMRSGLSKGIKYLFGGILRSLRKARRENERPVVQLTRSVFAIAILLPAILAVLFFAHSTDSQRWPAVFDSVMGMAMGGGIVWAVRIIASQALGVEAMGFGDVTLMCMIGAFVGWQPALLIFAFAPFTSIIVATGMLIAKGENHLAFGPYLCIATVITLIGWDRIWAWARSGAFGLGNTFLLSVLFVCLLLMAVMLGSWAQVKKRIN